MPSAVVHKHPPISVSYERGPTGPPLLEACQGQIATYKIPQYWKFVDTFPMTITGKTQKYRMREIAIEERELKLAA